MRFKLLLGYLLLIFACLSYIAADAFLGINIGPDRLNLPSVEQVVAILRDHKITHVRIFDSDSHFLSELANTGIEVMISVTNEEVSELGKSPSAAASWVNTHVSAFKPATNITAIAVGSEVPSSVPDVSPFLVSAMDNIYKALVASNLNDKVKVSTPLSMNIIPKPFPPSTATFNASLNSTIHEILGFLKKTNSFFMLNAYPYNTYVQSNGVFPIEYVLFQPIPVVKQIVDPNTLFHYESMLDAMVDAAYYSIAAYNTSVIPIIVSETGWPWSSGGTESDATVEHAETFSNNLVQRVLSGSGPPSQPSILMNSYIYTMFIDDKRPNYGVFFRNGSMVYNLDLDNGNSSSRFCVARKGADPASLQDGLNWACGQGQANCTAIQSGKPCYLPNTLQNHASYAYNDYYQRRRDTGGTCDFGGTAITTNVDPSYGSCIFTESGSNSSAGRYSPPAFGLAGPTGSASPSKWIPEIGYLMLATVFTWLLLNVQICRS
uniref:glucan endo-1,3-beta-glucosidase 4-like n=1 Tax=Erigeron canadensis TaxID=72917 RepID=UPI001CB8AABF|nr:glucan endo-1,3-beta-glucosidase 4-like [Erigeron canadensis]